MREAVVILGVERTVNDGEDACGCIDRHHCSSAAGFFAVGDGNWVACVMCNVKAEHVARHTSHVTRHTSHVTRHTSHVTRNTSHFTRHMSHVTRHTSHVTLHTSHATCITDIETLDEVADVEEELFNA